VDWTEQRKEYPHLQRVAFPKLPKEARISILIGTDYNGLFKPIKIVDNPQNHRDPWAVLTPLGWTCIGPSSNTPKTHKGGKESHVIFRPVLMQN